MARPETVQEIAQSAKLEELRWSIMQFDPKLVALVPQVSIACATVVQVAQALGLTVDNDWSGTHVYVDKTDAELESLLRDKQRLWDYGQKHYDRLVAGEEIGAGERYAAKNHAEAEGLQLPEEPSADETDAEVTL